MLEFDAVRIQDLPGIAGNGGFGPGHDPQRCVHAIGQLGREQQGRTHAPEQAVRADAVRHQADARQRRLRNDIGLQGLLRNKALPADLRHRPAALDDGRRDFHLREHRTAGDDVP
ncbi:hypothetical protein D3C87_1581350 [compost metagenome]